MKVNFTEAEKVIREPQQEGILSKDRVLAGTNFIRALPVSKPSPIEWIISKIFIPGREHTI